VSWLVWFNLLKLRDRPDWPQIWARLVNEGGEARPAPAGERAALGRLLQETSRSGSNSLAIAPQRTASGAALLANDPHLGLNIPNTWLIAGVKSPSYHVVGLMIPGLPIFGIGRNPHIAWGGTNMRASASDLVDIKALPPDAIRSRSETIRVRWWIDETITLRETEWGPILSDAPQLRDLGLGPVALRWAGHQPSDEISAMLGVARAEDFGQFRAALATFSMPAQNMLFADTAGNIGKVYAVQVPDRRGPPPADVILEPAQAARIWRETFSATDLPTVYNPAAGFIASGNNRPPDDVAVGFFFSPDDRVDRMAGLIGDRRDIGVADVVDWQRDVYVGSSVALRDAIIGRIETLGLDAAAPPAERALIAEVRAWDGYYRADSAGAVAFEMLRATFTADFYQARFGDSGWAAFAGVGRIKELLVEDIEHADPATLKPLLTQALAEAAARRPAYPVWGDMHRLVLQHPLAFLPVVGSRFRFADHPVGGSTDALMKTAHPATTERHKATNGSNARHISDLADPDANYFVVLGGQDGWLNSATFLDQAELWRHGRYIRVPLRLETVAEAFPRRIEIGR
jgi:penicillin amidase